MKDKMNRCVRCKGRKKIFKINSGYSYINTGGIETDCPMCLGKGSIEPFENSVKEVKEEVEKICQKLKAQEDSEKIFEKIREQKLKEKDFKDEKPQEEFRG